MKVGVNGAVRDISDLKVGVNGAVRAVSEAYIGVSGAVKKVWPLISIGYQTIFYKGIMPSEKVLDFPVDCNTLTGSVNL